MYELIILFFVVLHFKFYFIVKEYWFGSQEEKNGNFSIKNEYKTEGEAFLYYVQDYIDNEVFSTYEIKVVKENNLYKIDFISVM